MRRDSVLSLVSIAKKAGKVASGEFQTERSVKGHRAALVLISEEASGNTRKKIVNMCSFYQVPVYLYGTREELGAACGNEYRSVLSVLDPGLARAIENKFLHSEESGTESVENRGRL